MTKWMLGFLLGAAALGCAEDAAAQDQPEQTHGPEGRDDQPDQPHGPEWRDDQPDQPHGPE